MDLRAVLISILLLPVAVSAQVNTISGVVTDAATRQTVPFAHVFISNTTIGSVTDEQGRFEMRDIPDGPGQLIVSYLGYETFSMVIPRPATGRKLDLQIKLKPQEVELESVTVASTEDKEWQRNLKVFKREFLGKTRNAADCEIVNPWVLDFNKKGGLFQANASSPLQIVNRSLGYEVVFYLNQFEAASGSYSIVGPARFSQMQTTAGNPEWQANRLAAFQGSTKHFLKLLWKDQHKQNGFRVYKAVNALEEQERSPIFEHDLGVRVKEMPRQDLVRDDARDGLILVSLRPIEIHYEPGRDFEPVYRDVLHQVSWIQTAGGMLRFDSTGNILNPQDVTVSGYWNRLRVGDLLPLDYTPGEKLIEPEPEKLQIITDKGVYSKGSIVWYTVLVTGRSPSVHVQLVDSANNVLESRFDPVENGKAAGSFVMPIAAGTVYMRAITSSSFADGYYFLKPLLVTGETRTLACNEKEKLTKVAWQLDSVGKKEVVELSVLDPDQDTLRGNFTIAISYPGSDCDCLDGKWLSFKKQKSATERIDDVRRGKVTNKKGQALRGRVVFMTDNLGFSFERDLGDDGAFSIDDIITYDSTRWLVQMYDEKNRPVEDFVVVIDEGKKPVVPRFDKWELNCAWSKEQIQPLPVQVAARPLRNESVVRDELKLADSVTLLSEVTVRGRRIKGETKPPAFRSYGTPQYVVKGADLVNAPAGTHVLNALAGRVPGLRIIEGHNNWEGNKTSMQIRGKSSFQQVEDPLIILDGIPMDNFDYAWDILQTIPPSQIEKVEVRTSLSPMQGLKGTNGVISIFTKKDGLNTTASAARPSAFVRQVDIGGYSKPPRFERDSTSASTLHWQAEVQFGARPVIIDTEILPDVVDVVISGFTGMGEVVFVRKRLNLAERRDQLGSTSN